VDDISIETEGGKMGSQRYDDNNNNNKIHSSRREQTKGIRTYRSSKSSMHQKRQDDGREDHHVDFLLVFCFVFVGLFGLVKVDLCVCVFLPFVLDEFSFYGETS
jgi:hypothetical protein